MVNHRLEWVLKIAEKSKFMLRSNHDLTISLPAEYLHAMGKDWVVGADVEISNAWWSKDGQCHRIQIQLVKKKAEASGQWAK